VSEIGENRNMHSDIVLDGGMIRTGIGAE